MGEENKRTEIHKITGIIEEKESGILVQNIDY